MKSAKETAYGSTHTLSSNSEIYPTDLLLIGPTGWWGEIFKIPNEHYSLISCHFLALQTHIVASFSILVILSSSDAIFELIEISSDNILALYKEFNYMMRFTAKNSLQLNIVKAVVAFCCLYYISLYLLVDQICCIITSILASNTASQEHKATCWN